MKVKAMGARTGSWIKGTPTFDGERLYVSGMRDVLVCLDADSGRILWEHHFPVFLTDIVSNRLGWSSPAGDPETGNVYVHGTGGLLICLDSAGSG